MINGTLLNEVPPFAPRTPLDQAKLVNRHLCYGKVDFLEGTRDNVAVAMPER